MEWAFYLDGLRQSDVVAADQTEGWILAHKRDADGNRVVIGNAVATEKRFGAVRITCNGLPMDKASIK